MEREFIREFALDSIALEPHFRKARQAGEVQTTELDEGMFLLGLQAAAWRVIFATGRSDEASSQRAAAATRASSSPASTSEAISAVRWVCS